MIPSFQFSYTNSANDSLFKQYKNQLKKKENAAVRRDRTSLTPTPLLTSTSSSASATTADPAHSATPTPRDTPTRNGNETNGTVAGGGGVGMLTPSPMRSPSSRSNGGLISPSSRSSTGVVGGSGGGGSAHGGVRPRRLTQEEVNARWKEIFSTLEKWTADEPPTTSSTTTKTSSSSSSTASIPHQRVPSSYASAALAQEAYERDQHRFQREMEGHAIQSEHVARLVTIAMTQKANGLRPGERKVVVPALPSPPQAPTPPHVTPYAPVYAAVDREWRAELAANPDSLRGDALDNRALESRLMSYLLRDDHPVTRVKDKFVSNFLEAYSMTRNLNLKGCTTSQASDMLLSNTLPTLLYFLDLLTKLLIRIFPELDANRNPNTMESIRHSSMECIFPSIFPTLFALYKRKYFFRDAELSSKMSVLSSIGQGGCNITLDDLGVSKWFCLDEGIVEEEMERSFEKRRQRERQRRRKELGETEEEAERREEEEERKREQEEREWYRMKREMEHADATSTSMTRTTLSSDAQDALEALAGVVVSPPHIRNKDSNEVGANGTILAHPISQLTQSEDGGGGTDGDATPRRPSPASSTSSSATATAVSSSTGTPRSIPGTPLRGLGNVVRNTPLSSIGTSPRLGGVLGGSSPRMSIPQTRLEHVSDFESGSLGRSPRAEKIQDILARSPSRRIVTPNLNMTSHSHTNKVGEHAMSSLPRNSPTSSLATARTERRFLDASSSIGRPSPNVTQQQNASNGPINSTNQNGVTLGPIPSSDSSVSTVLAPLPGVDSGVPPRTSSPMADAKKQVGFSTTAQPTSPTNTTHTATATTTPGGGLAAALKHHRTPVIAHATPHAAAAAAVPTSTPSRSSDTPRLGLASARPIGTLNHAANSGHDSDDSPSTSPRMPVMNGMPILGSSMPMLQGLPNSMLTHTPGSGSALLQKELQQKKKNKSRMTASESTQSMGELTNQTASSASSPSIPSPQHLAAQQPFVLNSSPSRPHGTGLDGGEDDEFDDEPTFPFQEAVVLLRRLSFERTPRDKLSCLIAVSQEVCWCVDRFYSRDIFLAKGFRPKPEELCINADDLLSIVSFILIKSQLANVISEAAFIDDFISRSMKLHMPGYFLATLQASIEMITKLDKQKFLTREMVEQELRDGSNGIGPSGHPTGRRPSYLAGGGGTGGLLSPSAAATSQSQAQHHTPQPSPASKPAGDAAQVSTPTSVQNQMKTSPTLNRSITTPTPSSRATNQHTPTTNATPVTSATHPTTGSTSLTSAGVTIVQSAYTRSLSFHSSPGSRIDSAEPEATSSTSWSQPFELKLEHFPSPQPKPTPQKSTPIRKLAHAAMGQTRGV